MAAPTFRVCEHPYKSKFEGKKESMKSYSLFNSIRQQTDSK